MWPSINLEDLQRSYTLLHLGQGAWAAPRIFAHVHAGSVYLGAHCGVIAPWSVDKFYVMDLDGDTAETYDRVERNRHQTTEDMFGSTRVTVNLGVTVLEVH